MRNLPWKKKCLSRDFFVYYVTLTDSKINTVVFLLKSEIFSSINSMGSNNLVIVPYAGEPLGNSAPVQEVNSDSSDFSGEENPEEHVNRIGNTDW